MTLDYDRKTPDSIEPASDLCRKWHLWHRGDYIDSIICCKLFSNRHQLTDTAIAGVLRTLHDKCANMTGKDVAELYHFLETNPDLHTNGIRLWQRINATAREYRDKDDDIKVALAIARFSNNIAIRKH